jgi:hypothetical protein
MTAIADFLRARYAEDADAVRANWHGKGITSERYHGTPIDPVRLLADIEAKTALIDEHPGSASYVYTDDGTPACGTCGDDTIRHPCRTLRLLAQPFDAHPDYRQEWMP